MVHGCQSHPNTKDINGKMSSLTKDGLSVIGEGSFDAALDELFQNREGRWNERAKYGVLHLGVRLGGTDKEDCLLSECFGVGKTWE